MSGRVLPGRACNNFTVTILQALEERKLGFDFSEKLSMNHKHGDIRGNICGSMVHARAVDLPVRPPPLATTPGVPVMRSARAQQELGRPGMPPRATSTAAARNELALLL